MLIGVNLTGYTIGLAGMTELMNAVSEGTDRKWELMLLAVGVYYFFSVGVCIMRFLISNGWSSV